MLSNPFAKLGDALFAAALPLTPSNPAIHPVKSADANHNGSLYSQHKHPSGSWVVLEWSSAPTPAQLTQAGNIVTGYVLLTATTEARETAKDMLASPSAERKLVRAVTIAQATVNYPHLSTIAAFKAAYPTLAAYVAAIKAQTLATLDGGTAD
jgi:hypothetical protein